MTEKVGMERLVHKGMPVGQKTLIYVSVVSVSS